MFIIDNEKKKRNAEKVECGDCGIEFLKPTRFRNRNNFCSRECYLKNSKRRKITKNCTYCGKEVFRTKSKVENSKSGLFFCDRKCKDLAQRIESGIKGIQPSHYGKGSDYRKKAFANFENVCNNCGYDEYKEGLQVHHKDKNRSNNELVNLEILCATCHTVKHLLGHGTARGGH
jgi:hypothetical protein